MKSCSPLWASERVAENDLRAHFFQFVGRHRLDGAVRADGHEDRRLHDAVVEGQFAAAGLAARGFDLEGKSHFVRVLV